MVMDSIQYNPERILNGFTIGEMKELAKKLKRKIRSTKSEIIEEILAHPRGKPEDRGKVWQEINRYLRKELEALSEESWTLSSSENVPREERFKVGYMFTLSPNSEIRALGEEIYSRAEEDNALNNTPLVNNEILEEAVPVMFTRTKNNIGDRDTIDAEDLYKKIKLLEHKLQKANSEGQRAKGQLEKLKIDTVALKAQLVREKEESGKFRNRVKELEEERADKNTEQSQQIDPQKAKDELCNGINFAAYEGRKALIFAEPDNEVDSRLNALGIIPIWAMEIDWNRPRRRMSTSQVVLYKTNEEKLNKLEEIREIAKYWNIPCYELLNFRGGIVHD